LADVLCSRVDGTVASPIIAVQRASAFMSGGISAHNPRWIEAEALSEINLDATVDRLVEKGYLREVDGQLHTCACPVVRAQRRRSNIAGEIQHLVQRVHATLEVRDLLYRDLLHYAWHADQAETALRSKEEKQAIARRATDARMSDRTPFDMRTVCTEAARRADLMREDVDVYWESCDGEPTWIAGPEAPYAYMVRELLTNAISAVGDRHGGQSRCVWLSLDVDEGTATVAVSDNGPGFPNDFLEAFAQRRPLLRTDQPDRGNIFHKLRLYAEENGAKYELGEPDGGGAVISVRLRLVRR
ncbi:MAG: ATP-binding protein, partial [Umezawaea sp.]